MLLFISGLRLLEFPDLTPNPFPEWEGALKVHSRVGKGFRVRSVPSYRDLAAFASFDGGLRWWVQVVQAETQNQRYNI